MSKKKLNATPKIALAFSIQVYREQGFIRSGEGYYKAVSDEEDADRVYVSDNKSRVIDLITQGNEPSQELLDAAQEIMDKFSGKFMLKKLTDGLTSFEKSVADAFANEQVSSFSIAVLASIPHMDVIDIKRQVVNDRIEALRFDSDYFGESKKRYDINVDVIDVKYIQSSGVYMITTVYNKKDIVKFWWRDQPDLTDIIDGRTIKIRGTVNRHEVGKYSQAKETMLNRVKIISN